MPPPSHGLVVEAIRSMMSVPSRLPKTWYDAAADEAVRVMRSPAHRVAFFSCARQIYLEEAYGRHGFWARLPGLMPPALFVWGDRDRLVPGVVRPARRRRAARGRARSSWRTAATSRSSSTRPRP